ncbi:MAG: SpoIIE family protein phosphatase [Bacteroidetes bacterium]|nr:SpoIIE family protein phosphatase [Bacteroidota bacterium]
MKSITQYFIPRKYKEGSEDYRRSALLVNVFLLTALICLGLLPLGFYIKYYRSFVVMPIGALAFLINTWLVKKEVNYFITGNLFAFIGSVILIVMMTYSGGIYSPVTPWIAAGPTFALLLVNRKSAWIWTCVMIVVISTFSFIEAKGLTPLPEFDLETKPFYFMTVFSSLILLMLTINMIFEKNKNDALQKVEAAKKSITDSINYARRIQSAILPTALEMQKLFGESFVLFKPKDIISGDFYWTAESNGKKFIAAADCTGHGVPGALMSMVGNELLNKIVFEKKITSVDEILNQLHSDLCSALRQSSTEVKDGMDIVLISVSENKEVEFAGAKNALYYVDTELHSIAGNRETIGGDTNSRQFTKHTIPYVPGTSFYLCTDGIQDQFGGDKGKKFMIGQLKRTLQKISALKMEEQKTELTSILQQWQNEYEQTDDVLIIGIKL